MINNKADFYGEFKTFDIKGSVRLSLQDTLIKYYITSKDIKTITPFMDFLNTKVKIPPTVSNWIYKYITAKRHKIEQFYGEFDYKTLDFLMISQIFLNFGVYFFST